MDTETLLRESRAERLLDPLHFATEAGKSRFQQQLRLRTSNVGILQRRQDTVLHLRNHMTPDTESRLEGLFQTMKELEPELSLFFKKTDVETNSYEQLLFSGWKALQVVNTIPFALLILAFFKQYIVPAMAVCTPVFMVVLPFFFLKYWYNLPITIKQYSHILFGMMGIQSMDVKNPRAIFQGGLTLFSIGQSIYQPIQNALHLQTIHAELVKKAEAAQRFVKTYQEILSLYPSALRSRNPLEDVEHEDIHRLFATFWDYPSKLQLALCSLGDCEVIYRLATASFLHPVQFFHGDKPHLHIQKGVDPFLSESIPFTLKLSSSTHHAILTGPNRGGKSSVLRSTLLSIVFAQTFGLAYCAPDGSIQLRPFDWIATGLRLEDRPGAASMFESEVDFAVQILQRAHHESDKIGCILFDELFHSTNPPDGARAADIFLQKLWQTPNTASFISTHVFELAKKSHKQIQKLCVPAHQKEDGSLHFTYTLKEGICEVSSVDEILKEKGLFTAESSTPENPRQ
jgi:hypothetical protein